MEKMIPGKRNDPMGKMKSYIMEVDECVVQAIEAGARNLADIKAFCHTNMTVINEIHIANAVGALLPDSKVLENWHSSVPPEYDNYADDLAEHVLHHFLNKDQR
jgi:hypothetical protein